MRRVLALAGLVATVIPAVPAAASAGTSVTMTHSPPSVAIAGDALPLTASIERSCSLVDTCGDVYLKASYLSRTGQTKSIVQRGTSDSRQTITIVLPGGEIGAPAIRYRLEAYFSFTEASSSPTQRNQAITTKTVVDTEPPTEGFLSVPVEIVVRSILLRPDGSAASGVPVLLVPFDEYAAGPIRGWSAVTNGSGAFSLRIPNDDPWVVRRLNSPRSGAMWLTAFDNWPQHQIAAGVVDARDGLGLTTAFQVSLGDPLFTAAPDVQDRPLTLGPTTETFSSDESCTAPGSGSTTDCTTTHPARRAYSDIAYNIGAGADFTTRFSFVKTKAWSSSIGVRTKSNGPWTSEGRVAATDDSVSTASGRSGDIPSGSNFAAHVLHEYEHKSHKTCSYFLFWSSCIYRETVRPVRFLGVNANVPTLIEFHDDGVAPDPEKCGEQDSFADVGTHTETETSRSRGISYGIDLGTSGGWVSLSWFGEYSAEQGQTISYVWWYPVEKATLSRWHYLYNPGGWNPRNGKSDTYATFPYGSWTHVSSNPTLAVPPRPRVCAA